MVPYLIMCTSTKETESPSMCQTLIIIIIFFILYPDSNLDHSQNLMGSKLDQDPSSDFFSGRSRQ